MLAILSKKTDQDTNVDEIEKKITDHNHDKYITNKLTAENFAARLEQANLITKKILIINCQILIEKLIQTKQNIYLLKRN